MIERWFKVRKRGSTVCVELLGGATTFITMAYIIVVNSAILSFAGISVGSSTVATILTAVGGRLSVDGIHCQSANRGGTVHGRECLHRVRVDDDGHRLA